MSEKNLPANFKSIDSPVFKKLLFAWLSAESGKPSEDAYRAIVEFADGLLRSQTNSVTLNARQLQSALTLANPDGDADPARWETAVTLTNRAAFRANDEDSVVQDCPAGLYLHFDDMPDEGMSLLSPDANPT